MLTGSAIRTKPRSRLGSGHQACSTSADLQTLRWGRSCAEAAFMRRLPTPLPARAIREDVPRLRARRNRSPKGGRADSTHGDKPAARRAETNITRKRQARERDEQHGKLVDLFVFQRDILTLIQEVPLSGLQRATGLSLRYVSLIRAVSGFLTLANGRHCFQPRLG